MQIILIPRDTPMWLPLSFYEPSSTIQAQNIQVSDSKLNSFRLLSPYMNLSPTCQLLSSRLVGDKSVSGIR